MTSCLTMQRAGSDAQKRVRCSLAFALLVIVTFACKEKKDEGPIALPPPSPHAYQEKDNIAALANGALIIDRSGENTLRTSAILAIDSSTITAWTSPPGDPQMSAVIALPVTHHIDRVAASTRSTQSLSRSTKSIRFEASNDGVVFQRLAEITRPEPGEGLSEKTPPTTARFVRVTVLSTYGGDTADLISIEVHGAPVTPRAEIDVSGTWTINDKRLTLRQSGSDVEGITTDKPPMRLRGSADRGVVRFVWNRDAEVGFGSLTVGADATRLNAVLWNEKPIPLFFHDSWYGEKVGAATEFATDDEREAALHFLRSIGRYPTYRIRFSPTHSALLGDESKATLKMLLSIVRANPQQKFVLAAFRSGEKDEEANRAASMNRAVALNKAASAFGPLPPNLSFARRGSHHDHDIPMTELDRPLYDRVDLEFTSRPATTLVPRSILK